ncbi:MAG: sensor of ECF-type sigma factor [Jejuia sp.]
MKKILLIATVLLSITVAAQQDRWEKIKALKVAFITEALDLSEKESQEFWPIYNEFEEASNKIRHQEMRAIRNEIRENAEGLTDEKALELIKKFNAAEERMYALRKEFSKKVLTIIPAKKIIKLKLVEEDFKRKMLKEFQKRKKERG